MKKILLFLILSISIYLVSVGTAMAQREVDFRMTLSGFAGLPIDFNNQLEGAQINLCAGKSNLYKPMGARRGFLAFSTGDFLCSTTGYYNVENPQDWTPDSDCPNGVKAEWIDPELTHMVRFDDGDLMYWVLNKSEPNYACYYPAENRFVITTNWLIIGGSGRFRGASGDASWELPMEYVPLGDPGFQNLPAPHDGVVTGTVKFAP